MNIKRFLLSVLSVFITYEALSFVIHSLFLSDAYTELAPVWRQDMMQYMWLMYLGDLLFVVFSVLIYTRWVKTPGIKSGLLFGFLTGLMMNTSGMINQFVVYPITSGLLYMWIFFGLIQFIVCGLIVGLIYKPK